MVPIGEQKFDIPRKYQNQIGIWYFCPKFLSIFLVFYRYFVNDLVEILLNIGIFRQNKIRLVFGFCGCHFIGIGLVVSVGYFPENDISSPGPLTTLLPLADNVAAHPVAVQAYCTPHSHAAGGGGGGGILTQARGGREGALIPILTLFIDSRPLPHPPLRRHARSFAWRHWWP